MIAVIPISGFTESNRLPIGMRRLWQDELRPRSSAKVFIHPPVRWKHDCRDLVGTLEEINASRLIIIGYSWGVGYGATRLAKRALRAGIDVRLVLSCDGVYRPTWLPTWANFLAVNALTRARPIRFPGRVEAVAGVRQSGTLPAGHDILLRSQRVTLTKLEHETHSSIDDAPHWRAMVAQHLDKLLP